MLNQSWRKGLPPIILKLLEEAMFDDYRKSVRIGTFNCQLNSEECNQWTEFASNHPLGKKEAELEASIGALHAAVIGGQTGLKDELESKLMESKELNRQFYTVAKEWYEELVKKRKEEDDE